jgi:ankyrin repeat protein
MPTKSKAWTVRSRDVLDLAACGEIMHFITFFSDKPVEPESPLYDGSESQSPKANKRPGTAASVISASAATADDVVKYADKFGYTALHVAATYGHFAICKLLLEHGADANAETDAKVTPLHGAAEYSHLRTIDLLLQHGADPTKYSDRYELPLSLAIQGHFNDAVVLLQPLVQLKSDSDDALVAAARGDILYFLLKRTKGTVTFTVTTESGDTPLHIVAKVGKMTADHFALAEYFVKENVVDVNATNAQGMTALMYAARSDNLEMILLLLRHGADATITADPNDNSRTAISYTSNDRVRVLLEEAERRCEFESMYKQRNQIPFSQRADFVNQVLTLKSRWDEASVNHRVYCEDCKIPYAKP